MPPILIGRWGRNYLRVRGEYTRLAATASAKRELPPRARRIHANIHATLLNHGTTSACAENTAGGLVIHPHGGNYLRVRGEYAPAFAKKFLSLELPPRARRIRGGGVNNIHISGTTSACAENTPLLAPHALLARNYLRVRGEYQGDDSRNDNNQELPPRARRIQRNLDHSSYLCGTTSACAENTKQALRIGGLSRNYLRVRGEYISIRNRLATLMELPPRARRIRARLMLVKVRLGTTSACAENTTPARSIGKMNWNYLRVRGEYQAVIKQ